MCASTHAVACACVHVCGCVRVCACEASSIKVSLMLLTIFKSHMVGQYIFILHYLFPPSDFSVTRSHIHISKDRQLSRTSRWGRHMHKHPNTHANAHMHARTHTQKTRIRARTHAQIRTHANAYTNRCSASSRSSTRKSTSFSTCARRVQELIVL